jgi:hypothetical protein
MHHWFDGASWEMVLDCMCKQLLKRIESFVARNRFVSLSVDKVTNIDNQYGYQFMCMWCRHGEECMSSLFSMLKVVMWTTWPLSLPNPLNPTSKVN